MTPKLKIKASKYLCMLLRHNPAAGNILLNAQGWAEISTVVIALKARFAGMTLTVLREIVAEDDKQRYSIIDQCIRANQGHSISVDLGLVDIEPPVYLYHGTARKTLWLIQRDGILPMDRRHVHLSTNPEIALRVGSRHGDPMVIVVRSWEMFACGHPFYRSENGVWLTDVVPTKYLEFDAET